MNGLNIPPYERKNGEEYFADDLISKKEALFENISLIELINRDLIKPGVTLYSPKDKFRCSLLENGKVSITFVGGGEFKGSLEEITDLITQSKLVDPWEYWSFRKNNNLYPLAKLKEIAFQERQDELIEQNSYRLSQIKNQNPYNFDEIQEEYEDKEAYQQRLLDEEYIKEQEEKTRYSTIGQEQSANKKRIERDIFSNYPNPDSYIKEIRQFPVLDKEVELQIGQEAINLRHLFYQQLTNFPIVADILEKWLKNLKAGKILPRHLSFIRTFSKNIPDVSTDDPEKKDLSKITRQLQHTISSYRRLENLAGKYTSEELSRIREDLAETLYRLKLKPTTITKILKHINNTDSAKNLYSQNKLDPKNFKSAIKNLNTAWAHLIETQHELIIPNLTIVSHISKKEGQKKLSYHDFWDYLQNGNLGIIRAAETFNVDSGAKFATYAGYWIKQGNRPLAPETFISNLSHDAKTRHLKVIGTAKRLEEELGRKPTTQEIASNLELSEKKEIDIHTAFSIKESISIDEDNNKITQTLEDPYNIAPIDFDISLETEGFEIIRILDKAEENGLLDRKKIEILEYLYGLNDKPVMTLYQIRDLYGNTSHERIRQLRDHAQMALFAEFISPHSMTEYDAYHQNSDLKRLALRDTKEAKEKNEHSEAKSINRHPSQETIQQRRINEVIKVCEETERTRQIQIGLTQISDDNISNQEKEIFRKFYGLEKWTSRQSTPEIIQDLDVSKTQISEAREKIWKQLENLDYFTPNDKLPKNGSRPLINGKMGQRIHDNYSHLFE